MNTYLSGVLLDTIMDFKLNVKDGRFGKEVRKCLKNGERKYKYVYRKLLKMPTSYNVPAVCEPSVR
jgi:hypothetical protein